MGVAGSAPQPAEAPLRLLVDGWRFVPHSYAVVNQWQLLALARRPDVELRVVDAPHPPHWRPQRGLFDETRERMLRDLPGPGSDWAADATLRVTFPYRLGPAPGSVTAVFGTSEYQTLPARTLADRAIARPARGDPRILIVSPSRWSAAGFARFGFPAARIAVVPHGVQTDLFRPDPAARRAERLRLGVDGFVFLSVGAMSPNKGIDLLLRAFGRLVVDHPGVRLVLKGVDDLYTSRDWIRRLLSDLPARQAGRVADRLVYTGSTRSMAEMAALYAAADAYVTPYRAEGFNVPVLEAMACGLPVICTAGGPTDEFICPAAARTIHSRKVATIQARRLGWRLWPSRGHLYELMRRVASDESWQRAAAIGGPAHVAAGYTWDHSVARLLSAIRTCRSSAQS